MCAHIKYMCHRSCFNRQPVKVKLPYQKPNVFINANILLLLCDLACMLYAYLLSLLEFLTYFHLLCDFNPVFLTSHKPAAVWCNMCFCMCTRAFCVFLSQLESLVDAFLLTLPPLSLSMPPLSGWLYRFSRIFFFFFFCHHICVCLCVYTCVHLDNLLTYVMRIYIYNVC